MRFLTTWIGIIATLLLLAGCFGDAGTDQNQYNGTWTVSYNNPADYPTESATKIVSCTKPDATVTLVDGTGTTTQALTCVVTTLDAATLAVISTITHVVNYTISIAINGVGTTNAVVNGYPHTGTCISTSGCSALAGTAALSITR
jgi:hypothetical protein